MARGRKPKIKSSNSIDELILQKKEEITTLETSLKLAKKELKELEEQKDELTKNELFEAFGASGKSLDDVFEYLLNDSKNNETPEEELIDSDSSEEIE